MAPTVPIVYTGQRESKNWSQKNSFNMMGKSRKFSAGHPTGLMSDYPHIMETMAESEGFGCSGRVDMDTTLFEGSCSPKRKCISLNGDSHDRFGVPVDVLSLSSMSKKERKNLELRLKRELEEVRILQRRVASFNANTNTNANLNANANVNVNANANANAGFLLSPSSDIRSCSDGQKRPALENVQKMQEHPSQGKKRLPPGGTVPRNKKGLAGHIEPMKQTASLNTSNALLMKQCDNLLQRLLSHQYAWVFNAPVDAVKLGIPDYFTVIKQPMDLGTVKTKLARGEYSSPLEFAADVRLTFSNAMTYNDAKNDVHIMAKVMNKHFEQRWKAIEKKIPPSTYMQSVPSKVVPHAHNGTQTNQNMPQSKKKKFPPVGYGKPEPVSMAMSNDEKNKLSMELENLLGDLPENIIEFLKENSSGAGQTSEDEIEIDIYALNDDVLLKLRKLLDDYQLEKKQQAKAEPYEMELHNESGFSNSSIQPGKGNDAVDEDVDVGVGDHPVSSLPPVEIEKDTANKVGQCSSPSSSSGDSGSSSCDSDTGSAHSSEAEVKKTQQVVKKSQGTMNAEVNIDLSQMDVDQDVGRNHCQNSLNQVKQPPQIKPLSVECGGLKEGESPACERQVSPDKLYRAALLRSRFADTILKAQEKTLDKGEKRDPEKLRLEREELEKRQREEKARLQAEAKAAEVARKKAEAEAAAEAKRKRELEREAARLALQQMEKTVDINENCRFLEDLEMLRAAPMDNLSNFMDDATPNDSPISRLGSFRLGGNSNPLEQLGLYMKDDDEEDEEVEAPKKAVEAPNKAPGPPVVNDVEEGEID